MKLFSDKRDQIDIASDSASNVASASRIADAFEDTPERIQRVFDRTEGVEEEKNKYFETFKELVEHPEEFARKDKERRVEENCGKQGFFNWSNKLASRDFKGEVSAKDEAIARSKKIGIKTAVQGGLALTTTAIIGGVGAIASAPVLGTIALSCVGGAVGRGLYEAYRFYFGNEREKRNDIEKANMAVIEKMGCMIDEISEGLAVGAKEAPRGVNPAEVEKMPQYQEAVMEVIEMMHDCTKRRVLVLGEGEDKKFVALGVNEKVEEKDKDKIFNIGEKERELRKQEKKSEMVADIISFATSLGSVFALKTLFANHAGQQAADLARERMLSGEKIGPYNFDNNNPAHKIFYENDLVKFVRGAGEKAGIIKEGLEGTLRAIAKIGSEQAAKELIKPIIALGTSGILGVFGGMLGRRGGMSEEKAKKNAEGKISYAEKLFPKEKEENIIKPIAELPPVEQTRPQESGASVEQFDKKKYIPKGDFIEIIDNQDIRSKYNISEKFGKYFYFYIDKYDDINGAVLYPAVKDSNGKINIIRNDGVTYLKKDLLKFGGLGLVNDIVHVPKEEEKKVAKNAGEKAVKDPCATADQKPKPQEPKSDEPIIPDKPIDPTPPAEVKKPQESQEGDGEKPQEEPFNGIGDKLKEALGTNETEESPENFSNRSMITFEYKDGSLKVRKGTEWTWVDKNGAQTTLKISEIKIDKSDDNNYYLKFEGEKGFHKESKTKWTNKFEKSLEFKKRFEKKR